MPKASVYLRLSFLQGIVTKFTLTAYPQGQVWGGLIIYTGDQFEALSNATSNFVTNNRDPKAAIITEFNTLAGLVCASLVFYLLELLR